MQLLKGYRTLAVNGLSALVAVSEMTGITEFVPPEYLPLFMLVVSIANIVLRFLTDTPVGSKFPVVTVGEPAIVATTPTEPVLVTESASGTAATITTPKQ